MAQAEDQLPDTWSSTTTLEKVVSRGSLPSLVRLESGFRGSVEELSFSQGDILALQKCTTLNGQDVLLAHYMSEIDSDIELSFGTGFEVYRALIILPMTNENVASMDVQVLKDPSGNAYRSYLTAKFPDYNWNDHMDELLKELGTKKSEKYTDVHVYQNLSTVPVRKFSRPVKEPWKLLPPKLSPRLGKMTLKPGKEEQDTVRVGDPKPPPRPPRIVRLPSSDSPSNEQDPKRGPSVPPRIPPRKCVTSEEIYEISDDGIQPEWTSFTFAEFADVRDPNVTTITHDSPETSEAHEPMDTKIGLDSPPPSTPSGKKKRPTKVMKEGKAFVTRIKHWVKHSGVISRADSKTSADVEKDQPTKQSDSGEPHPSYSVDESRRGHPSEPRSPTLEKTENAYETDSDDLDDYMEIDESGMDEMTRKSKRVSKTSNPSPLGSSSNCAPKENTYNKQNPKGSNYHDVYVKSAAQKEVMYKKQDGHDGKDVYVKGASAQKEMTRMKQDGTEGKDVYVKGASAQKEMTCMKQDGSEGKDVYVKGTGKKEKKPKKIKPTMRVHPQTQVLTSDVVQPVLVPSFPSEGPLCMKPSPTPKSTTEMSVKELCACLDTCGMPRLAIVCTKNVLDGEYISTIKDEDLSKPPFSLTDFELRKWHKIKQGWRPNFG